MDTVKLFSRQGLKLLWSQFGALFSTQKPESPAQNTLTRSDRLRLLGTDRIIFGLMQKIDTTKAVIRLNQIPENPIVHVLIVEHGCSYEIYCPQLEKGEDEIDRGKDDRSDKVDSSDIHRNYSSGFLSGPPII